MRNATFALALVAFALTPPPARGAGFEALLLDPDGRPAAGWKVSVVGSSRSTSCDAEGRFALDPAPPPPFRLVATGPGGEISPPVEVGALGPGPVELRLPSVVRDSVTVISGVAPGLDLLPASAATVVSAEAIEQDPPQRLVDALDSIAGASKLGEGADSVPALRGLARGRTLVLVDGARVSAERRAGPSATFVDPSDLASVEVLRGPGSVVYGSDAFGGVLHAVTRDPDPDPPAASFSIEGSTGGSSELGGWASGSVRLGPGSLLLSVSAVEAGDQQGGDGREIFNSSFESAGGSLRYVRALGPGRLRASLQVDRVEDLGKAAIDSREVRGIYPEESSDRFSLSWIGAPGTTWDELEALSFVGDYRIALDRRRAPTATSSARLDGSDTAARDAQLRAVAGRGLAGGRLQLGLDAHSRLELESRVDRIDFAEDGTTVVARTSTAAIEDARQVSSGLFATWERPVSERWSIGLGARGDRVSTRNRGGFFGDRSETATALSGNLAVTAAPAPGWSATAQLARGFRAPTLSDRFFRGPSGRGFVTGNPELENETSVQLDLALRRSRGPSSIAAYAYRYRIDDLIERYRLRDDFLFRNRGRATVEGIEVESQVRWEGGWALEAGAAWSRGETEGGEAIDDQPAPNGWLGARWSGARAYGFARLAGFLAKDDPGPSEVERPGYARVDLGGGWRFAEALELRLAVRNALDRAYTGSPDEAADRSPGRIVTLGLTGRF